MMKASRTLAATIVAMTAAHGCSTRTKEGGGVTIDGSSTVLPLSEAVAAELQKASHGLATVTASGTSGGFRKFCRGTVDVSGASRPINAAEAEECAKAGIEYVELPVAYDGIAVVVNPKNGFVDRLSVDELKTMWEPAADGRVATWSQIRAGWPDTKLHLLGAGTDSGTYDYFTAATVGRERSSRRDFTASEDDNALVDGVAADSDALGFFGYAYYARNQDKLKIVPIDDGKAENGAGAIAPTPETIGNGTYQPLSRPIFIYVSKKALERAEVAAFADLYVQHASKLSAEVGYIPLPERAYDLVEKRLDTRTTGSVFGSKGSKVGVTIEALLASEGGGV
jgi:phosphate transport system substrate-binding protein